MKTPKTAAIVTIRDAHKMTDKGRKAVAEWLRHQARILLKHGTLYDKTFTGKYHYR